MNQNKSDEQLGKFLSLILRHRPETIGIKLDEHGYANVDELLKGINKSGRQIDLNTLERIVRENNKNRYHFNEEHTKIRANQGHSIPVDLEFQKYTYEQQGEALMIYKFKEISLGIPVKSDNCNSIVELNENIPKIFCDFPLIGTEKFPLPTTIHSKMFDPCQDSETLSRSLFAFYISQSVH